MLITGATGKTGLPLVEQLADRKIPFRALAHSVLKEPILKKWTTDVVVRDYGDKAAMEQAFADDLIRIIKTWAEGKGSRVSHDVKMLIERKPISLREFFECHKDVFIGKEGSAA